MARLVTKFKYIKRGSKKNAGGYAKYIATREGVEISYESSKLLPVSKKQQKLIENILIDFPDSTQMLEYEDYIENPTIGNASEFITRALEDNRYQVQNIKTYADYIATRPRVEMYGSHGLFTHEGETVNLSEVSDELKNHQGNVWTVIISLRRDDAERLGYGKGDKWRDMLRSQVDNFSTNFNIPMSELKWYAAFHNESHHPHVHVIIYSPKRNDGFLTKKGVNNLRSAIATSIFKPDLYLIYEKKDEYRTKLRADSKTVVTDIVSKINTGVYDNPKLEEMLLNLADRLSKTSGKKVYGYLKSDVKAIVNNIVTELANDERIAKLYDLWCEQNEEVYRTYSENVPERIPLVDHKEFKSIKNAVIQEAMNILLDRQTVIDDEPEEEYIELEGEESATQPQFDTEFAKLGIQAAEGNKWSQYALAKIMLDKESEHYDPDTAVEWLIESARQNYTVAKYKLGKMFLYGEDVPKSIDYALRWLEEAVDDGNSYAEYLLGKNLLTGKELEQDCDRAEELLKKSADKGNKYAKYTLGKAYIDGILLLQNKKEGIRLITESANEGFTGAEYYLGKLLYKGEIANQDIENALYYLESAAEKESEYAAYLAGKIRLNEQGFKDIKKAIKLFEIAAKNGNSYAEYQLGRLYLYGKDVEKDYDKGMEYLKSSAEKGNQYAEQLIHSIENNRDWSASIGIVNLLYHLSRTLRNKTEDNKDNHRGIDRKLKRKIDEKKQAQGLRL